MQSRLSLRLFLQSPKSPHFLKKRFDYHLVTVLLSWPIARQRERSLSLARYLDFPASYMKGRLFYAFP